MGSSGDYIAKKFDGGALGIMISSAPMHVIEEFIRCAIAEHPQECDWGCEFPDPAGTFERVMAEAKRFDHIRQSSPIAFLCRLHMAIEGEEIRRQPDDIKEAA